MDEIKEVQLRQVCNLLIETDLSFQTISLMCGFESTNYLLSIFKKKFGITMTEFKKNASKTPHEKRR